MEAIRLQETLREQVVARDEFPRELRTVAGMDVSYDRKSPWIFAAVVVLRLPALELVDQAVVRARATFPYVPGLLSFRESPAGLAAWERLKTRPDCLLCDGHGYAHPRRFGFACHFGLLVDLPTIGCAKSVLVGSHQGAGRSEAASLDLRARRRGGRRGGSHPEVRHCPSSCRPATAIRSRRAVEVVLACAPRYRIPEPIRQAHALVNHLRRMAGSGLLDEAVAVRNASLGDAVSGCRPTLP